MQRTQVYLTESEHRALKALAKRTGRSFAATLREAIDSYLVREQGLGIREAIETSYGCWRDQHVEPYQRESRREWEQRESRNK